MEDIEHLSDKAKRDYEIISRALKGEQQAYTEIMSLYKDSIYFMLRKMVKNEIDAEDLTIETFGKAFKRLQQYTPQHAFSTWLFKIATNNCIDFLRKNRAQTVSLESNGTDEDGNDYGFQIADTELTPEEEAIQNQKVKLMHEVVASLKPRYRKIIELRYFEEYAYDEIAEEMKIPLGTVKAQLYRAKELLFEILKNRKERI